MGGTRQSQNLNPGGLTQPQPERGGYDHLRTDRDCGHPATSQAPPTAGTTWASTGCPVAIRGLWQRLCGLGHKTLPSTESCSTNGKGTRTPDGAKRGSRAEEVPASHKGVHLCCTQECNLSANQKAEATPKALQLVRERSERTKHKGLGGQSPSRKSLRAWLLIRSRPPEQSISPLCITCLHLC